MKITAVISSPRRNGNTAVLARAALRAAREIGAETTEIFLADYRIEFCHGCMRCMATGSCTLDDDAMELRDTLYESDGIILASPAYGIQPNARMKNFLTDRIGMFSVYTSALGGKYFAGISTAGGIGAAKVARDLAMSQVAGFFRRAYCSGSLGVLRGNGRVEDVPGAIEQAEALGQKLVVDMWSNRRYPFQALLRRILNRLVVRRVITGNVRENADGALRAVHETLLAGELLASRSSRGYHES